ncbi:glycosyltransferase [Candidatus Woesearchaeota archaeon]|nr:glycosyltransferase [Candidatus Woesearchaeota archaeon]
MNVEFYSSNIILNFAMVISFISFIALLLMFIIVIASFFKKHKRYDFSPNISILIPAYNEEKTISRTLRAVLNSNYDKNKLEIVVIDDGSTDSTRDIVKKFKKVRLLESDHAGKSKALNFGLKKAKYRYILSLDADSIIQKNFIPEIVKPFKDKSVGATNGIALIDKPGSFIQFFQVVDFHFINLIRHSFSKVFSNSIWFFGAAACYDKKVLDKIGYFSKKVLTEDLDIYFRINNEKYKVITPKNAVYYTRGPGTIKDLINQRMRWFYGGVQCILKHKYLFGGKSGFEINFLFANQFIWTFTSIANIFLVIYQVLLWLPSGLKNRLFYLFRWFSLSGPIYLIYMIPKWGVSFVSIFGILSGLLSPLFVIVSWKVFKIKPKLIYFIAIFFYYPYTLLLNLAALFSFIVYGFKLKKSYFID